MPRTERNVVFVDGAPGAAGSPVFAVLLVSPVFAVLVVPPVFPVPL